MNGNVAAAIPHDGFDSGHTPVVFIVGDDASSRESLERVAARMGWRAETFATAEGFLDRPRVHVANCLIVDVSLPGLGGLELQQRVAATRSDMPVVVLTECRDVRITVLAMKAGAVDYLCKPCADETLLAALGNAIERSRIARDREARINELRERYASLTRRERQVLALVVSGLLNKQVGAELGISEITVKAHRGRATHKMKARSLPELVTMAASLDSLRPG